MNYLSTWLSFANSDGERFVDESKVKKTFSILQQNKRAGRRLALERRPGPLVVSLLCAFEFWRGWQRGWGGNHKLTRNEKPGVCAISLM